MTHAGIMRCISTAITSGSKKEDGTFLDGKRDTYLFQRGEKANLIFIADNPGLWLFHCHMLEHHAAGMGAVIEIS